MKPILRTAPLQVAAAALALSLAFAGLASASLIRYELGNHPDGNQSPPPYGLRLDGLFGDNSEEVTFDFEANGAAMFLDYDTVNNTIRIYGQAYGGIDIGTTYSTAPGDPLGLWNIDFTYTTNVSYFGNPDGPGKVLEVSMDANPGNSGTIVATFDPLHSYSMVDQDNGNYSFRLATGHRGVNGLSGWGWVNHSTGGLGTHIYSSDWLFTARRVPDGGSSVLLLGSALGGLLLAKRRSARR